MARAFFRWGGPQDKRSFGKSRKKPKDVGLKEIYSLIRNVSRRHFIDWNKNFWSEKLAGGHRASLMKGGRNEDEDGKD